MSDRAELEMVYLKKEFHPSQPGEDYGNYREREMNMSIRNSSKALIISNNKILVNQCRYDNGDVSYDLPGGGQKELESMEEALFREVLKETGYEIRILRFAALAEEIYIVESDFFEAGEETSPARLRYAYHARKRAITLWPSKPYVPFSVSAAAARSVREGREGSRKRRISRSGFRAGRLRPHILAGTGAVARASSFLTVPAGRIRIGSASAGRTASVSVLTAAVIVPAPASVNPAAAARPVSSSAAA